MKKSSVVYRFHVEHPPFHVKRPAFGGETVRFPIPSFRSFRRQLAAIMPENTAIRASYGPKEGER